MGIIGVGLPEWASRWIVPIVLWTLMWKAIAAWKSARNHQPVWFVLFFVVGTVGILPIIYLVWFQKGNPWEDFVGTEKKAKVRKVSVEKKPKRKTRRKKK